MLGQLWLPSTGNVFSPTDISGLKIWLDASTLGLNDNDPVSSWTDASGTGNTVTIGGSARPLYKATGGPSSKPTVLFDNVDDQLNKNPLVATINQPNTVICVYDTGRPWESNIGSRQLFNFSVPQYGIHAGTGLGGGTNFSTGVFVIMSAIFNGASSAIYLNGSLYVSGNAGTTAMANLSMNYDGTFFFGGSVSELLCYDSSLSSTNRGNVESYLNTKWGVF